MTFARAPRVLATFAALVRASLLESVAYRAEMLVWVLTSTMPLIMLALYEAVAEGGPLGPGGRYGKPELVAYFLATFVVRQLTSSWVSWQINLDVRDGTLGRYLLRPGHPLLAYAAESVAAMPLRAGVAVPVAALLLLVAGPDQLTSDPVCWLLFAASVVGAWLISLFVSCAIGALAFFFESSAKVMDAWLALYVVFSGYMVPMDLFPPWLRRALDWMPFRYQIGLPVELVTGAHGRSEACLLVGAQLGFVAATGAIALLLWRRGLARFAAYGG